MRAGRRRSTAKNGSVLRTNLGNPLPSLRDSAPALVDCEAVTELRPGDPPAAATTRATSPERAPEAAKTRSALVPVLAFGCGMFVAILGIVAVKRHPRAADWAVSIAAPSHSLERVVAQPASSARPPEASVRVSAPKTTCVSEPAATSAPVDATTTQLPKPALHPADREPIVKKRAAAKKGGKALGAEDELPAKVFEAALSAESGRLREVHSFSSASSGGTRQSTLRRSSWMLPATPTTSTKAL